MKPRHAAALALVGWYLMVPPMVHKEDWQDWKNGRGVSTTPLSAWFTWNWFDTADACTKQREAEIDRFGTDQLNAYHEWLAGRAPSDDLLEEWAYTYSIDSAMYDAFNRSQCVATDDPRLAE